jgi:DNA replication initiation complex subunit (GINS family)
VIDILSTYREEKNNPKLTELPPGFFDLADQALHDMQSEDIDGEFGQAVKAQNIKSSARSLEMLSDIRLKKVLKGAIADAYREKPEHGKDFFTSKEKILYANIVSGIREIKGTKS